MRKKLALIVTTAAFALALVVTPAANASYIKVTVGYSATDLCRPAPDQLSYKIQFKAKVKRSGVPKPSKVRIGFQVLDASSLQVLSSGTVNLYKTKSYKAKTPTITVAAGESLLYHFNMKYTVLGKTSKSKITDSDQVPTVEQMDANPSLFPNC